MKRFIIIISILVTIGILAVSLSGRSSEQVLALSRSTSTTPNNNFMFCIDGSPLWKLSTVYYQHKYGIEKTNKAYQTCANTALGLYNPLYSCAKCTNFVKYPRLWGFKEISKEEAQPGDLAMFHDKDSIPWHVVIIDHFTSNDMYFNHSNGGCHPKDFIHDDHIRRWGKKCKYIKYYHKTNLR